ncbi:hypothetical protein VKT23_009920 [Stygiomarasmius scandens]|uniref:Myosin motor domain-containing protein n=1 Tax=Marasmiellus scandens TaxID=2682957 RepID=A0ABR1JF10_9AGAR
MNRPSTIHQCLEGVTDLSKLDPVSGDFMTNNIYTSIGSSILVSLNPHKYVGSNADSVMHKYAAEYRNTSQDKQPLPPHIFQFANNAYYHMRRTTQDQALVFSGETASGKSESHRLAIKAILELSVSNPGKKGAKLATQVPAAESFGNARTLFNPNASRFGKYTELQFTERGRLCGVKTLEYYLERNRVTGAPSEERQHLNLLDKTACRYLGQRSTVACPNGGRDDDALRFDQLKVGLKSIGLSKRHVAQTCQLLAAILHLGNLEFTIDRSRNEDAAVVRNTDLVKKEMCTIFLDPDAASDNRDELAKSLYSLLFSWLNEHINQCLCKEDFSTFIGLFDLPGPQNMTSRPNSLDQFCINFANERLQNWTQRRLFETHVNKYNAEGISDYVPFVSYFDNSECLRLLQNKPGGLIHIMDDQAHRAPKKTSHTMVEAFQKRWGNHSSFKTGSIDRSGFPTFTVNHFNGPVAYSSENFLERNLDEISSDFVSLLRGTEGMENSGSINPFVKGLFSGKQIATTVHPRNEDTIVSAQQNVKPMRAPSMRRKCTVRRMGTVRETNAPAAVPENEELKDDDLAPSASGNGCIAGEFRAALNTLFETLDETQAWHVFCVNPNDSQMPNQLEGRSVKGQVRSFGLPEIARRCVNVFEVGMTLEEFCERYKDALGSAGVFVGSDERGKAVTAMSSQQLPLVANASPFQRADLYTDEYEENRSIVSDDFDNMEQAHVQQGRFCFSFRFGILCSVEKHVPEHDGS